MAKENRSGHRSSQPASGFGGSLASEIPESILQSELPNIQEQTLPPVPVGVNPEEGSAVPRLETGHLLNGGLSTQDAMTFLSAHNRPHKIWRKRYAKLLVVGDAGLGKTTLIRTLLSAPGEKTQLHDGSETSIEQFRRNPASMCSQLCWRNEEDRVEWYYTIQDTPGYGDRVNIRYNINAMVDFVVRQNEKWFRIETSKKRPADMSLIEDPRIDVCLFCLPPHRLRYVDVKFMHELGKVVPIIPIITKADTMNIREATIFRQEVHSRLQNTSQFGLRGAIGLFEFSKETLERVVRADASALQFQTLPFLVVASNEVNMEESKQGIFWPERQYPWGTCEAFNPDHSDVFQLRMLLLKEGLEEISATKLERYELWRRQQLSNLRFGFHVKLLVLTATAFAAFGVGSGLASGKPMRSIVSDMGRAIWRLVRKLPRFRFSKKAAVAPALIKKRRTIYG